LTLDPGARVGALTATAKVTLMLDTTFPKRLAFAVRGWNRGSRNGAVQVTLCKRAGSDEHSLITLFACIVQPFSPFFSF